MTDQKKMMTCRKCGICFVASRRTRPNGMRLPLPTTCATCRAPFDHLYDALNIVPTEKTELTQGKLNSLIRMMNAIHGLPLPPKK